MSTLDVVAYAGERHGGIRPANFLDIGGGASAEVMANGLEIVLGDPAVRRARQRLRRHHRLRRGRQRDRRGVRHARLPRRGGHAAARRPAGRQQRDGGPAHPRRGRRYPWSSRWTRWTAPRGASRSWREHADVDLPDRNSRSSSRASPARRACKHTRRMVASGTNIVGGVNPRKAGEQVDGDVPVFGTVADTVKATGADVSVVFVPPRFAKDAVMEAIDAADAAGRGDHRGHPGARHRGVLHAGRSGPGPTRIDRAELPGRRSARASPTPASSRPTSPAPAGSGWSRSPAR